MTNHDSEEAVVVLYGSTARGDQDPYSDLDVLVVSDDPSSVPSCVIPQGASLSYYAWPEWERLRCEGSIFLYHLAAESRVMWARGHGRGRYLEDLLNLPPYRNALKDFDAFSLALKDIRAELDAEDGALSFELATLAMVARHTSILVCYMTGEVNFSRLESMQIACKATLAAPSLARDFETLYAFRLADQRGMACATELPEVASARMWIDECEELVQAGRELVQ